MKSPSETNITPLKPVDIQRVRKDEQTTNGAAVSSSRALRNVCVYCGSGVGENPIYAEAAHTLGRALGENGIGLVYGGGGLGLMGEVARAALAAGGSVTGIIPEFLTVREHMLREVTDLIVTRDMHERKRQMYERSDAFVALPGGIGTLEELIETLSWARLALHHKPIIVLNQKGFWTPLRELFQHLVEQGFAAPELLEDLTFVDRPQDIFAVMEASRVRALAE